MNIYDEVKPFIQGVAIVIKDNNYGAILAGGMEIIPPSYDYLSNFENGYATAIKGNNIFTINLSNHRCVSCEESFVDVDGLDYDEIRPFHEGCACVRKKRFWGVINKKGSEIESPNYLYVSDIRHSYTKIMCKYIDRWEPRVYELNEYYLSERSFFSNAEFDVDIEGNSFLRTQDKNGNLLITVYLCEHSVFSNAGFDVYNEGNSFLRMQDKNGTPFITVYDKNKNLVVRNNESWVVVPSKYKLATFFEGGLCCCSNYKGLWGAINEFGEEIIPDIYKVLLPFSENKSIGILPNGDTYLVSCNNDNLLIAQNCCDATKFLDGTSIVKFVDGKRSVFTIDGKMCFDPIKGEVTRDESGSNTFVINNEGYYGYYDLGLDILLWPKYKKIISVSKDKIIVEMFNIGVAEITSEDRYYVNNGDKKVALPRWCAYGEDYEHGYSKVYFEGKWGVIDENGVTVLTPRWRTILEIKDDYVIVQDYNSLKRIIKLNRESYGGYDLVLSDMEAIEWLTDSHIVKVKSNKKWGIYDCLTNRYIIQCKYENIIYNHPFFQVAVNEDYSLDYIWGLCDIEGNSVLDVKYKAITVFQKGYARFGNPAIHKDRDNGDVICWNGHEGIILSTGQIIAQPDARISISGIGDDGLFDYNLVCLNGRAFEDCEIYIESLRGSIFKYDSFCDWCTLDSEKYHSVYYTDDFDRFNIYSAIPINGKGKINKQGQFVVKNPHGDYIALPKDFDWAYDYYEGTYKVIINGKTNFLDSEFNLVINNKGKIVPCPSYIEWLDSFGPFDYTIFHYHNKDGIIDINGRVLFVAQFDSAEVLSNGLIKIGRKVSNGQITEWFYGIIDLSGRFIAEMSHKIIMALSNELIALGDKQKGFWYTTYVIVNKEGKDIFNSHFRGIGTYKNITPCCKREHYIYKTGIYPVLYNSSFFYLRGENGYGIIDKCGNIILDFNYSRIIKINTCYFLGKDGKRDDCDGEYRFLYEMLKSNNESVKLPYEKIFTFTDKIALVKIGSDSLNLIDERGILLLPRDYRKIEYDYEKNLIICNSYIAYDSNFVLITEKYEKTRNK